MAWNVICDKVVAIFPANCTCCLLSSQNKNFIHSLKKEKKKKQET